MDLRAVKKWNSRHAVMGSQSVLPGRVSNEYLKY